MAMTEEPRWTLITGASSGIGAELARVFAARGYAPVITARRHERLQAMGGEIGPAPMMRMEEMSVRFGIGPPRRVQPRGRRATALQAQPECDRIIG